jgi:hypothetical protein
MVQRLKCGLNQGDRAGKEQVKREVCAVPWCTPEAPRASGRSWTETIGKGHGDAPKDSGFPFIDPINGNDAAAPCSFRHRAYSTIDMGEHLDTVVRGE